MVKEKEELKAKQNAEKEMIKQMIDRIVGEVEQLAPGQSLTYKIPEYFWGGLGAFLVCDLNPSFPGKGKKYNLGTDKIADGKPAGAKMRVCDTNKPKDFADWVWQFKGERFS